MRRIAKGLVTIMVAVIAVSWIVHLANQQEINNKAEACQLELSTRCLVELALMHHSGSEDFNFFDASRLRDLGFLDPNDAISLFATLTKSTEEFESSEPSSNPPIYAQLLFRLLNDHQSFGNDPGSIISQAERAARDRREETSESDLSKIALAKWHESLLLHGKTAQEWLFFVRQARLLGETERAKDALVTAIQLGEINRDTLIAETQELYGIERALEEINSGSHARRPIRLLRLASTLQKKGKLVDAQYVLRIFSNEFGESFGQVVDDRSVVAHTAALLTYHLGDYDQARQWADRFSSLNDATLDAAELYVEIEEFGAALELANDAIELVPEPGQHYGLFFGGGSTTPLHNELMGRLVGLLCKAGIVEEALGLTEGKPQYGYHAAQGCFEALAETEDALDLAKLADSLNLYSARRIREIAAADYVERGDYERARTLIRRSLLDPTTWKRDSRPYANLRYLRLAVAMRDENLVLEIVNALLADVGQVEGEHAFQVYLSAADIAHSMLKK